MEILSSATAKEHSPQRSTVADASGDVESALILDRDVEVCWRRLVLRALRSATRLQVTLCEQRRNAIRRRRLNPVQPCSCAKDLETPSRPSALRHHETAVTLVWRAEPMHRFVLDVFEMRTPLAESTWRNTHPNLTSPAEMIWSGAVLGDLRDFEAMKIGKQLCKLGFPGSASCEEQIGTQWQLDLFADLKASIEGVRHEADTDTRTARRQNIAANTRCRRLSLDMHFLTRTKTTAEFLGGVWRSRVQTVGGDIYTFTHIWTC